MRPRGLQPGSLREPDDLGDRLGVRPQRRAERASVPRLRQLALGAQKGDRDDAPGVHDQSRRRRRADGLHRSAGELRRRDPGALPQQLEDRHLRDRDPGPAVVPPGVRLHRRTEARRSVPALPDRLRLRDQREAGRDLPARSADRPADRVLRRPAAGALRRLPAPPLLLRSRPDGDPHAVHGLPGRRPLLPLEHDPRRPGIEPGVRPRVRPQGHALPGAGAPVPPAARGRHLESRRRQLLRLHPEARPR